ncbi:hypothetical protein PtrSN002B_009515 [Pyrenophora tritici-repentis]|uniref:Amelogenin domain containing protein n=1 Tax=Pyrenophora tritici-repentis TaxID=45151 RepID=A0A2W1HM95_9PLEO|nr:Amelogenin domain containing protein [Pyrenophora tritici-repentis]KAI0606439.1 hypothetical protein TUN205_09307 [Pyrenophora tritici-repentis]KAI0618467.1 hypothetical protein TUN199_09534 [Pyrenophora tritici-repentis]KAI1536899.1 hypothetical protein PtrSN002B_009515 [Pyrenophora tritici-repentis]
MPSPRPCRSASFSSDKAPSLASSLGFQMPTTVRPSPAYIAASVASQTVTDHHNAQMREEDVDADELQNAIFSEPALALLNAFLDHLLFAFLTSARSPSLAAIRPAISDVLKPRLAREAMEAADEELEGLLAGEDDDDAITQEHKTMGSWDVEKMWKRTRLRIMVYTRLGEFEDEDEERFVQQERGLSMDDDEDEEAGLVSWSSAIFLTSVVEYVAEQLLLVSGSAALARMASRMKKLATEDQPIAIERLIIEEPDVEKIALNSTLGRLWRTWRKRVRSPLSPMSPGRGVRASSSYSSLLRHRASRDTINTLHSDPEPLPEHPPTETDIAANIPLPIRERDVDEIEVPGLAPTFEDESENSSASTPISWTPRPMSVLVLSPVESFKKAQRKRPTSTPLPSIPQFSVPEQAAEDQKVNQPDKPANGHTETSEHTAKHIEASDKLHGSDDSGSGRLSNNSTETVSIRNEQPEPTQAEFSPDPSMVAFAATTGMGFGMNTDDPVTSDEADKQDNGSPQSEVKVMRSKRMSIERPGPPGLVRTFSTRSNRSNGPKSPHSTPGTTPRPTVHNDPTSYLDMGVSDDEEPAAIGIAKTSDSVIQSASTTPQESPHERSRSGGYVEVQPRSFTPKSLAHASTPPPDGRHGRPIVPDRSMVRKEVAANLSLEMGAIISPRRPDVSRSVSRGSSLPALQEVDSSPPSSRKEKTASTHTNARSIHTDSPKRSPTTLGQDVLLQDKRLHRVSTEESTRERSSSDNTSLGRHPSTSSSVRRLGAIPVSSGRESVSSHRSRGLSGRMSEEDRAREFDSLVKGKDTVKFTLTPQSMRDLDEPVQKKGIARRPSKSSVTVYPRVNADDASFGTANLPNTSTARKGPTASNHKPSPSRKVVTRPLARDPKIESESMRDFADFIRSTGPSPGQEQPVRPFVNISGNGSRSASASTSSLGRKLSTRQPGPGGAHGASHRPRPSMEPRSPAGLSSGNGDLIDFIRQGPPDAHKGQPRIPKNIAPFRTTVDSDQFDSMLGGHGNVESAYGSAASTLESKDSTQTINSRTGLIPSPSVVQPAYSNTPQQLSGSMSAPGNEPHVTKTRRRVKDPQPQGSRQTQPKQESFMDFLNDMEPPSNTKPQPFVLSEETIAAARARANSTRNGNGVPPPKTGSTASIASDAPRAYKPRLQARAPAVADAATVSSRAATSDLADFFKNSAPPEPPVSRAPVKKEEEKKSRKFWSRKKTYGDLP